MAVLNVFLSNNNAISTDLIENALGEHDRITLYRTLKTFVNKGLIHEIALPGDQKRLALCGTKCSTENHQHEHLHFQCNTCNEVYCLPIKESLNIEPEGFKVNYYEVIANGICRSCCL